MNEDIRVTFIIPNDCRNENECSEDMQLAFVACEQHIGSGLQAKWVHENQWTTFDSLSKRDVFVLTEFEGQLYEKLRATKCLVVGPRCLSCCLTEGAPIPSGPEPVFTVAMRGLVVTASGLTKQDKENIKRKVHWMGGIYNTVLTDHTTHLVSDTVLSDKYIKSVEKGIPVMSLSWIEAVWTESLQMNISACSSQFDSHKLPALANLQITTTSVSKHEKQMIMKLVNEHGGVFSGAFQSETTDVLVLNKNGVGSEKYKAAVEYGKACVTPAWVRESCTAGAARPLARYRVAGASTSSPLSVTRPPDMTLNFSRITNVRPPNNFVDETGAADITTMSGKIKMSQESKRTSDTSLDKEIEAAFDNLDMSLVKTVGPIFDGFTIWVTGVSSTVHERCRALISRCGGVRCDGPSERVTHVVCVTPPAAPPAPLLSPLWLVRSVIERRALPESEFVIGREPHTPSKTRAARAEVASPMSKRNLQLLRRPLHLPPPRTPPREQNPDPPDDLLNHYLSQNVPEEPRDKTPEAAARSDPSDVTAQNHPDITDDCDEPTDDIEQIFKDMKLEVQGLDEEAVVELGAEVAAAGGTLVAAGAGGGYVLVPLDFDTNELITKDAEAVTVFWVKECLSVQEVVPIQYYHRPVRAPAGRPLRGVVASLSTYSGLERAFLDELAKLLGATTQLRFCRRTTSTALASTHLICPTPSGDKYAGAVKWALPAVTKDWLIHCCEQGRRVYEGDYLVGDTVAPPLPQDPPSPPPPDPAGDKENGQPPPDGAKQHSPKLHTDKVPSVEEMSPASRYIALARQGLLGDSQETPAKDKDAALHKDEAANALTPTVEEALSSPALAAFSPRTRAHLRALRRGEIPSDPVRTPADPFSKGPATPESGFGAALCGGSGRLSPESRRRLWSLVHTLPGKEQHRQPHKQTPLSEIRNRFLAQFAADAHTPPADHAAAPRKLHLQEEADTPPAKMARSSVDQSPGSAMKQRSPETSDQSHEPSVTPGSGCSALPAAVDAQLQRLNAALSRSTQRARRTRDSLNVPAPVLGPESEPAPSSQPNTVGWDDGAPSAGPTPVDDPPPPARKRFMLSSNVDNREEISEMITYLGGEVSLVGELDSLATHLLCAAPVRSEKMLGSIAAGRWVLHPAYVARSRAAGAFLPEEEFEWGNPLATCLPVVPEAQAVLARAAHRWRVARRQGGPFSGVVALLHMPPPRRKVMARLVEAGGGRAPDIQPPYTDESITVCFADISRYPLSARDGAWLVSRGVPVAPPVLLSAYITEQATPDPRDHCLPAYRPR